MWHAVGSLRSLAGTRSIARITAGLGFAAALLTGLSLAWAQVLLPPSEPAKTPPSAAPAAKTDGKPDGRLDAKPSSTQQLREGTELVDQVGQFKISADRVLFVMADGNRQLTGLENLNLERVVKVVSGNPEVGTWLVTGTVTEFRGNNYLLIHRAVLKSRVKP